MLVLCSRFDYVNGMIVIMDFFLRNVQQPKWDFYYSNDASSQIEQILRD